MSNGIIVIFGRKLSDSAVRQRLTGWRDGEAPAGAMAFAPDAPALRLGGDDGVRYPPAFLANVPDTGAKLAWLKTHVARDLDVFARNPRRLLDLYFEFVAARVAAEEAGLTRRREPLGGLFRAEDWAFAALRPLPNAVVFDAAANPAQAPVLRHDLAFWTGREALAIRVRGSETAPPREAEALGRLAESGVRVVSIPAQELADGIGIFSQFRFPPEFLSFWQDAPYPSSPFRPQGLPCTLSLD